MWEYVTVLTPGDWPITPQIHICVCVKGGLNKRRFDWLIDLCDLVTVINVCNPNCCCREETWGGCSLVCFQYMSGRQTTAIPRVASAAEFIEPTQGFDSHVSVIHPSPTDSLQNQFDRSQVRSIILYYIHLLRSGRLSPMFPLIF